MFIIINRPLVMEVRKLMWHIDLSRILKGLRKIRKVYRNILYFLTCIQSAGSVLERTPAILIKVSSNYFKAKTSGIFETGFRSFAVVDSHLLG